MNKLVFSSFYVCIGYIFWDLIYHEYTGVEHSTKFFGVEHLSARKRKMSLKTYLKAVLGVEVERLCVDTDYILDKNPKTIFLGKFTN